MYSPAFPIRPLKYKHTCHSQDKNKVLNYHLFCRYIAASYFHHLVNFLPNRNQLSALSPPPSIFAHFHMIYKGGNSYSHRSSPTSGLGKGDDQHGPSPTAVPSAIHFWVLFHDMWVSLKDVIRLEGSADPEEGPQQMTDITVE